MPGKKSSDTLRPPLADADDDFHMADTDELETLSEADTDVLEALEDSGEPGDTEEDPGCDPYNNAHRKSKSRPGD